MFHIRGEGEKVRNGFNFYPWRERKWSIGFIFVWNKFAWRVRYAPHIRYLHCYVERDAA